MLFAVELGVGFIPGLLIGLALRLRGWTLAAAAPLLTYGVVGIVGILVPHLGLRWSIWTLAGASCVLSSAILALRLGVQRYRKRSPVDDQLPESRSWTTIQHVTVGVAVAFSTLVGVYVASRGTGTFTAIPQVWDSIFHSNAIRFIADTGLSDPDALRNLNDPDVATYYYPNAFHTLAATAVQLTGASVATIIDVWVGLVTLVLALGMVALVKAFRGGASYAVATAVLAPAFTAFPWDLLPWGTLLPYIAALAVIPAFLAVVQLALEKRATPLATCAAVGGIGILALHPSGAVAAAFLAVALLAQRWPTSGFRSSDLRILGTTVALAVLLGLPLLLASLGAASGPAFDWPADLLPANAAGQVFFLSHGQPFPQYWLVALCVLGLAPRRALRPFLWFVTAGVIFAGLFVLAAAYEGSITALLTRPWWNDRWRFAALWSLAALLLAGAGAVNAQNALLRLYKSLPHKSPKKIVSPLLRGSTLALILAVAIVATNGLYVGRNSYRLSQGFTDGPTVSRAELQAFEYLAEVVPKNQLVMNDGYDGSSMMYALCDVRPVFASPVIAGLELPTMDPDRRLLFESFSDLDNNAAVRAAVDRLGIKYVILSRGFVAPANSHAPGMQDLSNVKSLKRVFQNSDSEIFMIDPA